MFSKEDTGSAGDFLLLNALSAVRRQGMERDLIRISVCVSPVTREVGMFLFIGHSSFILCEEAVQVFATFSLGIFTLILFIHRIYLSIYLI